MVTSLGMNSQGQTSDLAGNRQGALFPYNPYKKEVKNGSEKRCFSWEKNRIR